MVERVALEEAAIRAAAQVRAPGPTRCGTRQPALPGAAAGLLLILCFLAVMISIST